jgi:NAD+ diphosphatase
VLAADAGQVDYYLLDVSHLPAAPALGAAEAVWAPLRARAGPSPCDTLECDEAALLGTAAGMAQWHRSVTFCAQCGSADVKPYREGKGRQCAVCKARFRPRLDASIIVLVTDRKGERCLLGRSARWPEGRYSTLAGFLEFGETLEECVVREVEEEAGRRAHVGPPAPIIVLTMHLPCTYHALTMHVICAYYLPTMRLLLCTCSRTRGQGRPRLPPLRRIAAMALPALDDGGVHRAGRGRGRGRAAAG